MGMSASLSVAANGGYINITRLHIFHNQRVIWAGGGDEWTDGEESDVPDVEGKLEFGGSRGACAVQQRHCHPSPSLLCLNMSLHYPVSSCAAYTVANAGKPVNESFNTRQGTTSERVDNGARKPGDISNRGVFVSESSLFKPELDLQVLDPVTYSYVLLGHS